MKKIDFLPTLMLLFFFFIFSSSYLLLFPVVDDPLKRSSVEKVEAPGVDICSH